MVKSPNKNVKRLNVKQKRTLVQLSVAQKQQVVLFATQNKDMTNLAIAEKFGKEFNLRIAPQTLCGWLKDSSKYLNIEEPDDFNIRLRIAKYPALEECLAVWHSYQVSKNIPVCDEMLIEKAKDYFGPLCGVDKDFKYSNGWLSNFKKRYHITLQTIAGESGSVDKLKVEEDRKLLRKVKSVYDFEKYLNCDNDVQTSIDMTDEEIVNFCMKKPSVEIEEELEELSLENEPKKRIPTLAEAKSAYEIIYDRLSQSKDFDEEGIEILLKLENLLNKKTELKQKNINDYF